MTNSNARGFKIKFKRSIDGRRSLPDFWSNTLGVPSRLKGASGSIDTYIQYYIYYICVLGMNDIFGPIMLKSFPIQNAAISRWKP